MKRSKRIEVLDHRPVNKDGFIDEWPEMGFVSMHSPYDPKPSVKIEDGIITELDGKKRDEFDFLDQFIADYAIRADRAEAFMAFHHWRLPERSWTFMYHVKKYWKSFPVLHRPKWLK